MYCLRLFIVVYNNYIVYYSIVVIVVCSVKSMCITSFVVIGCCVSELHGHICPHRKCMASGYLSLFYKNYVVYQIVYIFV